LLPDGQETREHVRGKQSVPFQTQLAGQQYKTMLFLVQACNWRLTIPVTIQLFCRSVQAGTPGNDGVTEVLSEQH
jgi:hypothetical protein